MNSLVVSINQINPSSIEEFNRWYEVFYASATYLRDAPAIWPREALRNHLTHPARDKKFVLLQARRRTKIVGICLLEFSVDPNDYGAEVDIEVLPDYRRQKIGTALFNAAKAYADNHKVLFSGEVYPSFSQRSSWPGTRFVKSLGGRVVHEEQQTILSNEAATYSLQKFSQLQAPSGFSLLTWKGLTPDNILPQLAALKTQMEEDVPTGDSEKKALTWTAESMQSSEIDAQASGQQFWTTAILNSDDELVGYTRIVKFGESNELEQDDTFIAPQFRGKGLSLPLKVASLRYLFEQGPEFQKVTSWVDANNLPMQSLNSKLGFETVELCQMVEIKIDSVC